MRIVSRKEWGARTPAAPFARVPIASRTASCVHHDGKNPIMVRTFAEAVERVRRDEAYHMNHNGWAGIGYNYLVISAPDFPAVDGLIFEARGRDAIGAHCLNWNRPWIGIQVAVGGEQVPSVAALASVRWLHETSEQAAGHYLSMKSHLDGFATECPGPILHGWVRAGMPVIKKPPTTTPPTTPEDDMLSAEAQKWLEDRMDAHDAYVLQNLKGTMGRQEEARDAVMVAAQKARDAAQTVQDATTTATLNTILSRLPDPGAK